MSGVARTFLKSFLRKQAENTALLLIGASGIGLAFIVTLVVPLKVVQLAFPGLTETETAVVAAFVALGWIIFLMSAIASARSAWKEVRE